MNSGLWTLFLGVAFKASPGDAFLSRLQTGDSGVRKSRGPRTSLWGGWQEPTFHEASLLSNDDIADGVRRVLVEVPETVAAGYLKPGQFVQLVDADKSSKPNFFAIASPPPSPGAATQLEFLIKNAESNAWLTGLSSGSLQVSDVMGNGFPLDRLDDSVSELFLCASGTGIAPIRSAVLSGKLGQNRRCTFFYGFRKEENCVQQWVQEIEAGLGLGNVESVLVASQPSEAWNGAKGYVQDSLSSRLSDQTDPLPPAAALVIGQKTMWESISSTLQSKGVPAERIMTNF
uniref:FAD-binding FR-type domain-containing protein n=1 Tax=Chromera velia CCMP2878 TaxID=1169474 RepID=A0A0G4FYY5_9ALVE|mmetsp:Transcript_48228/g.95165  ORF Transcript_48228/g.95165 Transcript_48228/m.95165 type:complete len:288 (-) Transcript_48228:265-1128(-)|eukprot:Cvel_3901.t1-p1 / transcript=Cvel_3901.t1 / gene=Cvel_3901 / organism=Chromera_velia_CCMP2878 / gene_product=Fruit protein pKIWI502, putative / transcript_product=Fruit protein pKIWI502, putative / location=Cvel_scaffold165:46442-47302(+) / protein_length=287 / sequence_SO=supercontig / SO=protein_coding / is_pseudo=false